MRRLNVFILASALAVLALVAGCASIDPIEQPEFNSGTADFTRLVAIGNSLTMGIQNGGLVETRQAGCYAAQVARQMGKTVLTSGVATNQPEEFVMPGYGAPGTAGSLELLSLLPPTIAPIQGAGVPVNTTYPGVYNAMAVSGANASDVLSTVTSASNPLFDLVLRGQGTMIQQTAALQPTFVLLWIGANDVLREVTRGVPATEVAAFEADYRQIVTAITSLPTYTGMVAGNIPDVTTIPFTTTIPPFVVNPATQTPVLIDGHLVPLIGPSGPLTLPGPGTPGDLVTLGASSLMAQGFGIPTALGGNGQPLPGVVILTPAELVHISQRVHDLNQVIDDVAAEFGYPVADVNALLIEAAGPGLEVGGFNYGRALVTGGLFSLDGIHPTDMGHALVANLFIEAINEAYGATLQPVDIARVAAVDFGPAAKPGLGWWMDGSTAAAYEAMLKSPIFP